MAPSSNSNSTIPDSSTSLIVTAGIFMVVCPMFVVARLLACRYLRAQSKSNDDYHVGADGWWLIGATVVGESGAASMILGARYGFGKHVSDLLGLPNGLQNLESALKIFYADQIVYAIVMGMTKVAILMFYIRTFGSFGANTRFVTACWTMIWFLALYTFVSAYQSMAQCLPFELAWSGSEEDRLKHCINFDKYWSSRAGLNIFTDVTIALLPISVVWALQMNIRKKFMVCTMFALGLIIVVVSIVRTFSIQTASLRMDPTWNAVNFCILSIVENGLGIIVACLPPLPKALSMRFPRYFGWLSQISKLKRHPSKSSQATLVEKGFRASDQSSIDTELMK